MTSRSFLNVEKLNTIISVRDFGAKGDGVTDDTAAIQAAINACVNLALQRSKIVFPRGTYIITTTIDFPIAWARNEIDFMGSIVRYDGPVSPTASMFRFARLNNNNTFANGYLDADNKAGFVFYAVAAPFGGDIASIKRNTVSFCTIANPTVRGVQLGNQSVDGNDLDGADWLFDQCYFIHLSPAIAVRVDGDNCFNIGFRHCWFNAVSGSFSGGHLEFFKGSAFYLFDVFFGYLGSTLSTATTGNWCILLKDGNLTVVGCNTEEGSILKTENMVSERKNIFLANIMVNEGTVSATPEYAIYAPVGHLVVQSCTFGKSNMFQRNIYAGDVLFAEAVYLGTNSTATSIGKYELDHPGRCSIEGQYLGNVNILNANAWMTLWTGSAANDYPFGYQSSGIGTFSVTRSTSNRVPAYSPYSAHVNVSSGGVSAGNIDGLQARVPISASEQTSAKTFSAVARGVALNLVGTTQVKLVVIAYDASANALATKTVSATPNAVTGVFELFSGDMFGQVNAVYITATVGLGVNGASGNIYVNNLSILPYMFPYDVNGGEHWRTIADAWTKYPKPIDANLEYIRAGYLAAGAGGNLNLTTWANAAPTAGNWRQGDIVWNTSVTSGGSPGWICVTAGTPGTWKAMANVAA